MATGSRNDSSSWEILNEEEMQTLLLQNVPSMVGEGDIREAVELVGGVRVVKMRMIGDQVLVTVKLDEAEVPQDHSFRIKNNDVPVIRTWEHYPNDHPVVLIKDLPQGVTTESIESYLDGIEIETCNIDFSEEDMSASIELNDPTDLPFLLCKQHKMKRQVIEFIEASVVKDEPPSLVLESLHQQNLIWFDEPHALKVTGLGEPLNEALSKNALMFRFTQPPYYLKVKQCLVEGDIGYVTFIQEDGISVVMNLPPTTLLGSAIEVSPIPLRNVPSLAPEPLAAPCNLLIENLPSDLSSDVIKMQLTFMFKNIKHEMLECVVEGNCAYCKFKDAKSVSSLIDNPPDNGTLCGHPVKYTIAENIEVPDPRPHVLVVRGLPTEFQGVQQAFAMYLKNTTKTPPLSCEVHEDIATVKFRDKQLAKQIAQAPPTTSFFGRTLEFSAVPDSTHPTLLHRSSDPSPMNRYVSRHDSEVSLPPGVATKYTIKPRASSMSSNLNSSDTIPPKPLPRKKLTANFRSTLVVRNLPEGTEKYELELYLEFMTSKKCKDIKIKGSLALVEMVEAIDITPLHEKLRQHPFKDSTLNIQPLQSSSCVLIRAPEKLSHFAVKMYCMKYCKDSDVRVEEKGQGQFIVTFTDEKGLDILKTPEHIIGTHNLKITSYHPVLAEIEETDSPDQPPPLPPRPRSNTPEKVPHPEVLYSNTKTVKSTIPELPIYQVISHREQIPHGMGNYMMHILTELNNDLIKIHGECHIEKGSLEVRPFRLAHETEKWSEKVKDMLTKHKQDFKQAEIPLEDNGRKVVLEYLVTLQEFHADLYYTINEGVLKMGGCSVTINEAVEAINNIVVQEVEVTIELQHSPRLIEYLLKFAKREIDAINPPVTIKKDQDTPGKISIHGVKQSLDLAQKIAHEKIAETHTDYVLLTQTAHRLLSNRKAKTKITQSLGDVAGSVFYVFEKIDQKDEFTRQVCIMSSDSVSLAVAKRKFESLIRERKIPLPTHKLGISSSQEWKTLVETLTSKHFISISSSGEWVTVLGNEDDLPNAVNEVSEFLDTQNNVSDEFVVNGPKWQVIVNHRNDKLLAVKKVAEQRKLVLTLPEANEDAREVFIGLQGNVKAIEDIKFVLQQLVVEVECKEVKIPPQPGLQKVMEKGMLGTKCHELQRSHKVVVKYEVQETTPLKPQFGRQGTQQDIPNAPHREVNATSPNGIRVLIYQGDFAKMKCDAIATFITETPTFNEPVLMSLSCEGGQEVRNDFESSLNRRLFTATVHKTHYVGNLKCSEICHVVVPKYSANNRQNVQRTIETATYKLLEDTCQNNSDIVITPLTSAPLNYPPEIYAQALISTLSSTNLGMYSDFTVKLFIDDPNHKSVFEEMMRDSGYSIHHVRPQTGHIPLPSVTRQRGDVESLKRVIKITKGNILDVQADVYINSTGPEMDFSTGALSNMFKRKCGKKLMDEVQEYIKAEGTLQPGKVAVTSANNTKAKAIYHISLEKYIEKDCRRSFRKTIQNILLTAKDNGHTSIAIPCLGVANLGYPPNFSASILFEEVVSFHYRHPTAITCFHFVVYRDSDEKDFFDEYKRRVEQVSKLETSSRPVSGGTSGARDIVLGSMKIEVINGSIADEQTEVIVNSTSVDMKKDANQITKAIHEKAGPELQLACSSLVSNGVFLSDGVVMPTGASGMLRCDKVYHAHVPGKVKGIPPKSSETALLQKVVRNSLEMAEDDRQISISFPAFCLGIGNYTIQESGEPMFSAISDFMKTNPKYLKEVHIVVYDKKIHDEFLQFFLEYFKQPGSSVAKGNHVMVHSSQPKDTRPRGGSYFTHLPAKPIFKKCSVSFQIYGVVPETLTIVEKQLRGFINECIVMDMVDLGDTTKLFQGSDCEEMVKLGEEQGVEVEYQPEMERVLMTGEELAVEKVCNRIQLKKFELSKLVNELQLYEWYTEKDFGGIRELYSNEVAMQLEVAYKRKQSVVEVMADGVWVTVNLNAMEERDEFGIKRNVFRDRKMQMDYPHEWSPQPNDSRGNPKIVHFVDVPRTDHEYVEATDRFLTTLGGQKYAIIKVQRIQNPAEYTRYHSLKTSWEAIHGPGVVKEKLLFHGTQESSVMPICSQGFNRSFAAEANAAHYGKGVYFALNASYSVQDKYSEPDKNGHKHILVCSLLVGKYTKGNKIMKVPPSLPNNPQILYDTLVENENNPTIFVAMKDSQAYPKYWITFKK